MRPIGRSTRGVAGGVYRTDPGGDSQYAQQSHRPGVHRRGADDHWRALRGVRCLLITDEIYEHIVFDGERHTPPMTLPGLRERCVLVNSLSKTYSVTGWRVGMGDCAAGADGFHS